MNVSDGALADIARLVGGQVSDADMAAVLKAEEDEGYRPCSDEVMAHFLNGLVIHKRGKDPSRPPQPLELPGTNNAVLKKLRVAFELKDSAISALILQSG